MHPIGTLEICFLYFSELGLLSHRKWSMYCTIIKGGDSILNIGDDRLTAWILSGHGRQTPPGVEISFVGYISPTGNASAYNDSWRLTPP